MWVLALQMVCNKRVLLHGWVQFLERFLSSLVPNPGSPAILDLLCCFLLQDEKSSSAS